MTSIEHSMSIRNTNMKYILEFGVYRGESISKIKSMSNENDIIYGFDSFEGLPENWNNTVCEKGFFSTDGEIPNVEGVKFIKGWFSDTLPEIKQNIGDISVLHIDCDLYSSTKTVLWELNDKIKPSTIICFDEWIYSKTDNTFDADHEQKCFFDYCEHFNRTFEYVEFEDTTICGHERKIVKILG